ncbi:MAG TPA: methyltransferase domain-containing protein [Bryobacteraceae bacterium]|nr:methyltransferase domain-containing protein [Bryobacteraceae bacterium]
MNLKALRKHWDQFASRDPLWAILTHPDRKDSRWDVREFFETGAWEIGRSMEQVAALHPNLKKRRALDFGCGVGRLTQPLAQHFEEVHGVDISASMIQQAADYNQYGNRCQYSVNPRVDLRIFPDQHFDFIYSNITLQHMPPRYSRRYIAEFLRVLALGGALLFQLPSETIQPGNKAGRAIRTFYYRFLWDILHPDTPYMGMYGMPKDEVVRLIAQHGGRLIHVAPDPAAEPEWKGYRYLVTRNTPQAGVGPVVPTQEVMTGDD